MLSRLLYNISTVAYTTGIRIAAYFNHKAKLWVEGRKNWQKGLGDFAAQNRPSIWMHCASLGEFEQGRPVLEAIKTEYPDYRIVLSFFSPSGYEIRKNYSGADLVTYLPSDTRSNAEDFIALINPALVLWVKYEYWFEYLDALHRKRIPVILFAAKFREGQPFFKPYGGLWREMLDKFSVIFVQDQDSLNLLKTINIDHATIGGDTRFDRVATIKEQFERLPLSIENFCEGQKVIVAGSTWKDDEMLFTHLMNHRPDIRYIIVPHEIHDDHIRDILDMWPNAMRYTVQAEFNRSNILIIDTIGMLNRLYNYGDICYVGGGFNDSGIHNTLEAAVYSKAVVFGPEYSKFNEAVGLINAGAAISVNNALELEAAIDELFGSRVKIAEMGVAAGDYVQKHTGATTRIMDYIAEKRLLTR